MPAKKKVEKPTKTATKAPTIEEVLEQKDDGDKLREEGIIATFANDSNQNMHRNVRDISVSNLSVTYFGTPLIDDAELTLNYGNRYVKLLMIHIILMIFKSDMALLEEMAVENLRL